MLLLPVLGRVLGVRRLVPVRWLGLAVGWWLSPFPITVRVVHCHIGVLGNLVSVVVILRPRRRSRVCLGGRPVGWLLVLRRLDVARGSCPRLWPGHILDLRWINLPVSVPINSNLHRLDGRSPLAVDWLNLVPLSAFWVLVHWRAPVPSLRLLPLRSSPGRGSGRLGKVRGNDRWVAIPRVCARVASVARR